MSYNAASFSVSIFCLLIAINVKVNNKSIYCTGCLLYVDGRL